MTVNTQTKIRETQIGSSKSTIGEPSRCIQDFLHKFNRNKQTCTQVFGGQYHGGVIWYYKIGTFFNAFCFIVILGEDIHSHT